MTIETKYNIGGEVWTVKNGRARVGHIEALCFHQYLYAGDVYTQISYGVNSEGNSLYNIAESDLFPTKEELLKSL